LCITIVRQKKKEEARSGIFDKAIHDFTNAITINPRYELAYLNRGLTFQLMGAYDRAAEDLSKAILLNRSNAEAYVNRGHAFLKKGTTRPAFSDFQMACALGMCIRE